jgi:hypothetical protein
MRNRVTGVMAAAAMLAAMLPAGGGAAAKPARPQDQRPEVFDVLLRCRDVADDRARLACYDSAAVALKQAADRKDLVIVDRKQIRETKKSLFGLALPSLGIFGGGDDKDEADEVKSIEGVVVSATQNGNGGWTVRLEDGGIWNQTDYAVIAVAPKRGDKVRIVKAAMGSYMMRVGSQPGVRVRRQL